MKLTVDLKIAAPLFVYYYVSSPMARNKIVRDSEMTGVPKTNVAYLREFPIFLPPLDQQRAIAHILGTLDDKIELNRRMNETLEAIARAIFQSWFVDFDPVRAKASSEPADSICRRLGLTQDLLALFPDSFQESELGEIPEGWEVEPLGNLVDFAYGKALKETSRRPEKICVMGSNGQVGWHDERLVAGPGIVIGRKGNPGVVTWVQSDFFPIDTTFYVMPIGKVPSLSFLFYALEAQNLPSPQADSAVPGLNRNIAYRSPQLVPPENVLSYFDSFVVSLFAAREANSEQSATLKEIRDTLLPKLLSGEVRVRGADSLLAKAT